MGTTDRHEDWPFHRVQDVLVGDPQLSLEEVADRAGLPLQILRELFAAMDWADRPAYDERDAGYARDLAQLLDLYPLDTLVRSLRTRYRAITSIVVSDLGTVREQVVQPALAGGADAGELAGQLGGTASRVFPLVTGQLGEDYRHVLVRLLDSEALASGVQQEGLEVDLAVGFVDVSGYTALSGRVDPGGLDRVLRGFEDLVAEAVAASEDVLLAKFIGDAAMLVSPEVMSLAEVLLTLVDQQERLAEAPRRAGMAAGSVLVRQGDYYGPTTNLAARLTDHARPWSLLAAEDLEEALGDGYELTRIPKTTVRGIGDQQPVRVRRPD